MAQRSSGGDLAIWVESLPSTWTSGPERLVLYVLARDAQNGVTRSGQVRLAAAAGMGTDQLRYVLRTLCAPTGVRPALLERIPKHRARDPEQYRLAPSDRAAAQRLLPLVDSVSGVSG